MPEIRALTLTQPWATLVAIGAKAIETRSWGTYYRGPLAIHAAKTFPSEARELVDSVPFGEALGMAGIFYDWQLPLGAIVAVANLHRVGKISVHSVAERRGEGMRAEILKVGERVFIKGRDLPVIGNELRFGDYTPGRFGWVLTNVQRLPEPIPCRGALGIWAPPADVVQQLPLFEGAANA